MRGDRTDCQPCAHHFIYCAPLAANARLHGGLDHCPPQNEKRKLAAFPEHGPQQRAGAYLAALQRYFDNHFGFRNRLVRWNNHWKRALFHESPVNMAMQGRDGWLYWSAGGMLADYMGTTRFDEQRLKDWQKLLESRRDWLAKRGGKYIFVIAPDKHSVYPEYLPDWVVKSSAPSKLDQLVNYMRAHSTVDLLDLRPVLIDAKKSGSVFLKTDTHWNNFGAFVAYQALIRSLHCELPGLHPLPLDAFDRTKTVGRGGDLSVCLDQQDEFQETEEVRFTPRPPLVPLSRVDPESAGESPETGVDVTRNPGATGKVVLFRDSFAEKWKPFLGFHFSEAIYFRQVSWKKQFLDPGKDPTLSLTKWWSGCSTIKIPGDCSIRHVECRFCFSPGDHCIIPM